MLHHHLLSPLLYLVLIIFIPQMKLLILICFLVATLFAYTTEGEVLVLTDDDLPSILEDFPSLMIEFYAPWYSPSHSGVAIARP